jgi:hypothetical protein
MAVFLVDSLFFFGYFFFRRLAVKLTPNWSQIVGATLRGCPSCGRPHRAAPTTSCLVPATPGEEFWGIVQR